MEMLTDTDIPRSTTSHAIQLLMCHAGLQLFYDQSSGVELLKVSTVYKCTQRVTYMHSCLMGNGNS